VNQMEIRSNKTISVCLNTGRSKAFVMQAGMLRIEWDAELNIDAAILDREYPIPIPNSTSITVNKMRICVILPLVKK